MICISYYESEWNTMYKNDNKLGLFALEIAQCPEGYNLLNAQDNCLCARLILDVYGLAGFPAWNSYKCVGWQKCDSTGNSKKAGGPTASTGTSTGLSTTSGQATDRTSASGILNKNNKRLGGSKRKLISNKSTEKLRTKDQRK